MIRTILGIAFIAFVSYPIIGALKWSIGVICYNFLFKYKQQAWLNIDEKIEPFITIMVPAHNEEVVIERTINYLASKIVYTNYEILVMDDGSTDRTPEILATLQEKIARLRVLRIEKNKGKAHAFNVGLAFTKGRLILSNDADTLPEPYALKKYVSYFLSPESNNIAAITANMDVNNRSKLIGKSQTVEFSSIVGIIKRTQAGVFGGIYAYSGANTMYRKAALIDVGLFRQDRATEDISIAWDHQEKSWLSIFAPEIVFYMQVPETIPDLYRQRKRWAKGGTEVWFTNFTKILRHPFKRIGLTVMFIDQTFSILWSFFFWLSSLFFLALFIVQIFGQDWQSLYYTLTLSLIFISFEMIAGLIQLITALIVDDSSRKIKYLMFAPLYMLFYWIINAVTIVTTFIPAFKTIVGRGSGTWVSPKR
ncbi:glycosyltransferase [Weissella oryzae SG25]|uniref:Glycosyltransferase n=1 Tax=Weissella oryzae (strain DSM 25784 / JCM 18191 / LMG 30913 / SG25) TaxID=1329250 RepID=A0A069CTQ3_WEIOS|nr:glycosyltransferase [Weissella oryzae]GAK30854.1 glycosyltransferase [Weissella oryzae SG25]